MKQRFNTCGKALVCGILTLLAFSFAALAQESKIPQRLEVVEVEDNDQTYEIFNMPRDGENHYFLDVGTLGIGTEIVQIHVDPLFHLYIPVGHTLDEVMEGLKQLQSLFKTAPGTSVEKQGCLTPVFPDENELRPVKVTYRKVLLGRMLEFSIEEEDYIRSNHISKSALGSLVSSLKFYRSLHPKE